MMERILKKIERYFLISLCIIVLSGFIQIITGFSLLSIISWFIYVILLFIVITVILVKVVD